MKSNILFTPLPTEWNGYEINTGFHIGVQLSLLMDDRTINERQRSLIMCQLLFGNEDGSIREIPETEEEFIECISWFMGGWNMDNTDGEIDSSVKMMDYDVDQGRIYADFLQIYGIDLEKTSMHWWKFQWLLWNMPFKDSSFIQACELRKKNPSKNASKEERDAIAHAKKIYGLERKENSLSGDQIQAIDEFDSFMEKVRQK